MKTEIYTDETGKQTEVEFDDLQSELLESIDCYDKVYKAIGYDKDGNKYYAGAVFSCDELIEIENIERV